jgi:hypothetical protein
MRPSPLLTLRSTTPKFGIGAGARNGRGPLLTPPSVSPLGLGSSLGGTPGEAGEATGTPAGALLPVRENPHKLFIKTPPPATTPAGGSSLTPATPATASPVGRGGVTPPVGTANGTTGAAAAREGGGSGWRGAGTSPAAPAAGMGGGDNFAGGSSSKPARVSPAGPPPERTKASPAATTAAAAAAATSNGHLNGGGSKPRDGVLALVPTLGRLADEEYEMTPSEKELEVSYGIAGRRDKHSKIGAHGAHGRRTGE